MDSVLTAGRYETLGIAMNQVGENAGYSREQLDAYAASLEKSGIAMTASRELITQLAGAQVDLSHATDLARIAQDAAVIGGMNSTEAYTAMVHGIVSGQTDVLRGIGLQVNFEQAYAKMAASLEKPRTRFPKTKNCKPVSMPSWNKGRISQAHMKRP